MMTATTKLTVKYIMYTWAIESLANHTTLP